MRNLLWIGTAALLLSQPLAWAEGSPVRLSFVDMEQAFYNQEATINPVKSFFLPDDFGANGAILELDRLILPNPGSPSQHYFRLYFDHLESGPVRADAPGFGLLIGLDNDFDVSRPNGGGWHDISWQVMGYDWTPDSGVAWSFLEPLGDPDRLSLDGYAWGGDIFHNTLYVSPRQGPGIPAPVPEPASLAAWGLITLAGLVARRRWFPRQGPRPATPRS
jgi:hypothetical protein